MQATNKKIEQTKQADAGGTGAGQGPLTAYDSSRKGGELLGILLT